MWGRNRVVQKCQAQRENVAYLPGFPLPDNLEITADFSAAMAHVAGMTACW
jgi:glycerol-3-phosphate dehydrogenase (NAD(P)+)